MKTKWKPLNRVAVAKSLRELEFLFGRNDKGRVEAANVGANQSELHSNDSTTIELIQVRSEDSEGRL